MPQDFQSPNRLRVAAISFLNPAPLLWNFEHDPAASELRARYDVHYTLPAICAQELATGEADLGLIPIASLATLPEVVAVPGCTIAARLRVRSIQLVLRPGVELSTVASIAADAASRSSAAYVRILLKTFYRNDPVMIEEPADLSAMLAGNDAALLIGDPALFAIESRNHRGAFAECTWIDVAELWHTHTGLPWIAAVWAVRPESLERCGIKPEELCNHLLSSRDAGLIHVQDLVTEWQPRTNLPASVIHEYLTQNIHYTLDHDCLRALDRFFQLGEQTGVLPHYELRML